MVPAHKSPFLPHALIGHGNLKDTFICVALRFLYWSDENVSSSEDGFQQSGTESQNRVIIANKHNVIDCWVLEYNVSLIF